MVGDFLREAAVLVLIFATLEKIFRSGLSVGQIIVRSLIIVTISGILFFWGVKLEERSDEKAAEPEMEDENNE